MIGRPDTTAEGQELIHDLINKITGRDLNEDKEAAEALGRFEGRVAPDAKLDGNDVLEAFVAGAHAGSVAVARKWIKISPETALVYYSGRDAKPRAAAT
jgi:hypothetical protein